MNHFLKHQRQWVLEERFSYSKKIYQNNCIHLWFSAYYEECVIYIGVDNAVLFEANLENVQYMRKEEGHLRIHQRSSNIDYLINFFPNFFPNFFIKIVKTIEDPANY